MNSSAIITPIPSMVYHAMDAHAHTTQQQQWAYQLTPERHQPIRSPAQTTTNGKKISAMPLSIPTPSKYSINEPIKTTISTPAMRLELAYARGRRPTPSKTPAGARHSKRTPAKSNHLQPTSTAAALRTPGTPGDFSFTPFSPVHYSSQFLRPLINEHTPIRTNSRHSQLQSNQDGTASLTITHADVLELLKTFQRIDPNGNHAFIQQFANQCREQPKELRLSQESTQSFLQHSNSSNSLFQSQSPLPPTRSASEMKEEVKDDEIPFSQTQSASPLVKQHDHFAPEDEEEQISPTQHTPHSYRSPPKFSTPSQGTASISPSFINPFAVNGFVTSEFGTQPPPSQTTPHPHSSSRPASRPQSQVEDNSIDNHLQQQFDDMYLEADASAARAARTRRSTSPQSERKDAAKSITPSQPQLVKHASPSTAASLESTDSNWLLQEAADSLDPTHPTHEDKDEQKSERELDEASQTIEDQLEELDQAISQRLSLTDEHRNVTPNRRRSKEPATLPPDSFLDEGGGSPFDDPRRASGPLSAFYSKVMGFTPPHIDSKLTSPVTPYRPTIELTSQAVPPSSSIQQEVNSRQPTPKKLRNESQLDISLHHTPPLTQLSHTNERGSSGSSPSTSTSRLILTYKDSQEESEPLEHAYQSHQTMSYYDHEEDYQQDEITTAIPNPIIKSQRESINASDDEQTEQLDNDAASSLKPKQEIPAGRMYDDVDDTLASYAPIHQSPPQPSSTSSIGPRLKPFQAALLARGAQPSSSFGPSYALAPAMRSNSHLTEAIPWRSKKQPTTTTAPAPVIVKLSDAPVPPPTFTKKHPPSRIQPLELTNYRQPPPEIISPPPKNKKIAESEEF